MPDGWRGIVIVLVGFLIAVIAFRLVYNPKPPQELPVPASSSAAPAEPQPGAHAAPATAPTEPSVGPIVIAGHVVSEEHNALSGATLHLSNETTRQRLTSGIDGAFTFAEISSIAGYTLSVGADGFVRKRIELNAIPYDELANLTIELERGIVVTGVAVYPDGGLVEGLSVGLQREVPERKGSRRSTTDAHGRFEIIELAPGPWTFSAYRNLGAYHQRGPEIVLQEDVTPDPVRLVFSPPGMATIEGIVVDTSGAPIADAKVEAFSNQTVAESKSNAEGRFFLRDLLEATYSLNASKAGYLAASVEEVASPSQGTSIALSPAPSVTIRVVDVETEQPITTFGYLLEFPMAPVQQNAPYKLLDAPDGTLSIPIEMAGDFYFTVYAPGYCEGYTDPLSAKDYAETGKVVEVPMKPCAIVRGRVLDPAGNGVAGALITRRPFNTFMKQNDRFAQTGEDGVFTIDSPFENLSRLYAHHHAKGSGSYIGERGQPLPAEVIIVLDTAATYYGDVSINGISASKGEIVLQAEFGASIRGAVSPTGTFEIPQIVPGKYSVSAEGIFDKPVFRVGRQEPIELNAGTRQHARLEFRTGNVAIRGKAMYGDEPIHYASIKIYDQVSPTATGSTATDKQGTFVFEHLEPGNYRVEATIRRGSAEQSSAREIELSGADVNDMLFTWEDGGRVVVDTSAFTNMRSGQIFLIDSANAIVGAVTLELLNDLLRRDSPGIAGTQWLKQGETSLVFTDVPTGAYQVLAVYFEDSDTPNDIRTAEASVTVTPGEETTVALAP